MQLLFLDLETTGLDINTCHILEIAAVLLVGDENHQLVERGEFHCLVHPGERALQTMDPWCVDQHGKSGLTADVIAAGLPLAEAEKALTDWFAPRLDPNGERPQLCGSSIHFDRAFVTRFLPALETMLHYRMIDVSGIRGTLQSLGVRFDSGPGNHRAMEDIRRSLNLFRTFRTMLAVGFAAYDPKPDFITSYPNMTTQA